MPNALNYLIATAGGYKAPDFDYVNASKNALAIKGMEQQLADYPEERAWLREERGMKRQKFQMEQDAWADELQRRPFKHAKEAAEFYAAQGDRIGWDAYPQSREWFLRHGAPESLLPAPEVFAQKAAEKGKPVEDVYREFQEAFPGALKQQEMQIHKRKIGVEEREVAVKEKTAQAGPRASSDIGKLQEDRDRLTKGGMPENHPVIKAIDAEMQKKSQPTPPKVPSAGNAVDLAIMRKFGNEALTDPTKATEAARWLSTPEGKQAVRDATQDTTAPQVTYLQTGTGFVPAVTKGAGAGSTGKPIEGLGKSMPNETTTQLSQMKNTVDRINDLEQRASDPKMAKQFGPVEGRWTTLRQKMVENGPTQELMNEMNGLITMAYSLSGKQISVQEMEMLKQAILPTINQPYANFRATLKMSRKWLVSQHNDTLQYYNDTGHTSKIKPLELPQPEKQPTTPAANRRPPLAAFEGK